MVEFCFKSLMFVISQVDLRTTPLADLRSTLRQCKVEGRKVGVTVRKYVRPYASKVLLTKPKAGMSLDSYTRIYTRPYGTSKIENRPFVRSGQRDDNVSSAAGSASK